MLPDNSHADLRALGLVRSGIALRVEEPGKFHHLSCATKSIRSLERDLRSPRKRCMIIIELYIYIEQIDLNSLKHLQMSRGMT